MREVTLEDPFGRALAKYSKGLVVGLEIGGGTGEGSSQCIRTKRLFSIENHPDRVRQHQANLAAKGGLGVAGTATLPATWMSKAEVEAFYASTPTTLNRYPLSQVLGWYDECVEAARPYSTNAIEDIHRDHRVEFDFLLIDGGPFSGESELRVARPFLTPRAVVALDDVNDIKNWANYQALKRSAKLLWEDWDCRNGGAIFRL